MFIVGRCIAMSVDMCPSPAILHVCREAAAVFFATLPHAYIKVAALCLAAACCRMWRILAKCTATAAIFSGSPYHLVSHPSQLWKSTDMDGACRPTCLPEPSLQCGCRMNLNTKATRGQSLCAECIMAMHMRRSSPCYFSRANFRALNLTTPPHSPLRRCAPVYELHVAGTARWGLPFKVSKSGSTEHYQWSSSSEIVSCSALGEGVRQDVKALLRGLEM